MNWLQEHTLELLREIDGICQANGIPYYLAAGTMIGAMRHGGFIPWDDDADVYIKRRDWARFVEAFNRDPIPKRILVDPWSHPEAQYPVHRYIDTSTTQFYRMHIASPQPMGTMIDFLILDDIPDDEEGQTEHVRLMTEWANVLTRCTQFTQYCPSPIDMGAVWRRVRKLGRSRVLAEYEERLFGYPAGSCHHLVQCDPGVPHIWNASVFGNPHYVPFEDALLPVASDVHSALVGAFDEDWMGIPAAASHEKHIQVLDGAYPSRLVFDDAMRFIPCRLYDVVVDHRNRHLSRVAQRKQDVDASMTVFADEYVKLRYGECPMPDVAAWARDGRYDELDEFYADYLRYQCDGLHLGSPSYKGWFRAHNPLYIDLGDEFLFGALISLIRQRRIAAARKLLLARKRVGGGMGGPLQRIKNECALTKKLLGEVLSGEIPSQELISESCERHPHNPYLAEIDLVACFCRGEDALDGASSMLETFPGNAVACFLRAEALRSRGDIGQACESYVELFSCDRNGLVFKELLRRSRERLEGRVDEMDRVLASCAQDILSARPGRARKMARSLIEDRSARDETLPFHEEAPSCGEEVTPCIP